jgi:predicted DNA-binding antitoxin AbrB/MazE fold protein
MSIFDIVIANVGILKSLVKVDMEAEQITIRQNGVRQDLDRRLKKVTKATIDSEDEWFLELVKKDPDCALEVIKECEIEPILIPEATKENDVK